MATKWKNKYKKVIFFLMASSLLFSSLSSFFCGFPYCIHLCILHDREYNMYMYISIIWYIGWFSIIWILFLILFAPLYSPSHQSQLMSFPTPPFPCNNITNLGSWAETEKLKYHVLSEIRWLWHYSHYPSIPLYTISWSERFSSNSLYVKWSVIMKVDFKHIQV